MRHRVLAGACALGLLVLMGATTVSAQPGTEGFQVTGGIEPVDQVDVAKSLTGRLAETDPSLLGRTSSKLINVIVKLDYDPAAVYAGGLAGFKATSPSVTGRSLDRSAAAVGKYQTYVKGFEARATRAIQAQVPAAQIGQSFQLAYGGLSMRLPANQVGQLLETPGVAAVQRDALEEPLAVQEPFESIGASAVWPSLGGTDHAGEGVLVANLDTGVWPESPMLEDKGLPAPPQPYGCQFGVSGQVNDATFPCNHKLVGAYAFTDTYTTVFTPQPDEYCLDTPGSGPWLCSARDADGHGTHTLTTAAGGLRRQRADARHRPGADERPGAGRLGDRVPGVPGPRVLPVRQRRGRQPGDRRRRGRPQLLDQRGRERVLGRRRAGLPERVRGRDPRERLGRQRRSGGGDRRSRRGMDEHRRRVVPRPDLPGFPPLGVVGLDDLGRGGDDDHAGDRDAVARGPAG